MEQVFSWLLKHKLTTIFIVLLVFFLPLLTIQILFSINCGIDFFVAKWSAGELMTYIAGFASCFGTVLLGALALWQNQQIHNQHIESLEPILSMKLISQAHFLYLVIENTGNCEAKEINIEIEDLRNNGNDGLFTERIFEQIFELYPHEKIQRELAINGSTLNELVFPQISVKVSYLRPDINRRKKYKRTVTWDGVFTNEGGL